MGLLGSAFFEVAAVAGWEVSFCHILDVSHCAFGIDSWVIGEEVVLFEGAEFEGEGVAGFVGVEFNFEVGAVGGGFVFIDAAWETLPGLFALVVAVHFFLELFGGLLFEGLPLVLVLEYVGLGLVGRGLRGLPVVFLVLGLME